MRTLSHYENRGRLDFVLYQAQQRAASSILAFASHAMPSHSLTGPHNPCCCRTPRPLRPAPNFVTNLWGECPTVTRYGLDAAVHSSISGRPYGRTPTVETDDLERLDKIPGARSLMLFSNIHRWLLPLGAAGQKLPV